MSQGSVVFDAQSSAFRKKEKGEMAKELFPRAGISYWLCCGRISLAIKCN
jgi:hypothetical protein